MNCILDHLTPFPLRTWNKPHQNQSSGSVGTGSIPFPLSLIMRKLIALEQAKKGTRNVEQDMVFCFTQPIDLELTRNVLTIIVPFRYMLNILTSLLNFGHGIKDLTQFPCEGLAKRASINQRNHVCVYVEHVYAINSIGNCTRETCTG